MTRSRTGPRWSLKPQGGRGTALHPTLAEGATKDVTAVWLLEVIVGRTWWGEEVLRNFRVLSL